MAQRSAALQAEISAMDRIERAMEAVADLPEAAQARVYRWVADTYPAPSLLAQGNGQAHRTEEPQA